MEPISDSKMYLCVQKRISLGTNNIAWHTYYNSYVPACSASFLHFKEGLLYSCLKLEFGLGNFCIMYYVILVTL